jgi:hypothetical protein
VAAVVLLLLALHGGEGADGIPFKQPLAGRDLHNHSPARDVQAESPRPVLRGWPAIADLSNSPGLCLFCWMSEGGLVRGVTGVGCRFVALSTPVSPLSLVPLPTP